jgi:hypothetical protein
VFLRIEMLQSTWNKYQHVWQTPIPTSSTLDHSFRDRHLKKKEKTLWPWTLILASFSMLHGWRLFSSLLFSPTFPEKSNLQGDILLCVHRNRPRVGNAVHAPMDQGLFREFDAIITSKFLMPFYEYADDFFKVFFI